MAFTKEEYIAVGEQFASRNVQEQIAVAMELAGRDAALLAAFGWSADNTTELGRQAAALDAAIQNYERRFGTHLGRTQATAADIDLAKRWRLRAVAIGENRLTSPDALAMLRRLGGRAGRDPEKLGVQIQGLLDLARENETAMRAGGAADDAFFAEGARLVTALKSAATARRQRPKDLPAEHDKLDELDGRGWELLKRLSIAGKAVHAANGDRARMADYNLDILYGRPMRRRPRPAAQPAPGSGSPPAG
ncbi:MAG: hypothetical protein HY744_23525 [Deltaproteobacteria bacterium]|nr:hypothetical protein [Deltaproteobacteria bacterium]